MYDRGHELYKTGKVDGMSIGYLLPSKEYLRDPMDFSSEPTAICGNNIRLGHTKPCWRGEGATADLIAQVK